MKMFKRLATLAIVISFTCSFSASAMKTLTARQKKTIVAEMVAAVKKGRAYRLDETLADLNIKDKDAAKAELVTEAKKTKGLTPAQEGKLDKFAPIPALSATVTAKIKEIQDKFNGKVVEELEKFKDTKTKGTKREKYIGTMDAINQALHDSTEVNGFYLFDNNGKPYVGSMKKDSGEVLSSKNMVDEGAFIAALEALKLDEVVKAAQDVVVAAKAKKAGAKITKADAPMKAAEKLLAEAKALKVEVAAIKGQAEALAATDFATAAKAKQDAYNDAKAALEAADIKFDTTDAKYVVQPNLGSNKYNKLIKDLLAPLKIEGEAVKALAETMLEKAQLLKFDAAKINAQITKKKAELLAAIQAEEDKIAAAIAKATKEKVDVPAPLDTTALKNEVADIKDDKKTEAECTTELAKDVDLTALKAAAQKAHDDVEAAVKAKAPKGGDDRPANVKMWLASPAAKITITMSPGNDVEMQIAGNSIKDAKASVAAVVDKYKKSEEYDDADAGDKPGLLAAFLAPIPVELRP
ncbi:MAG: hypothetical protein WC192_05425 [Candidatus Babeliales bacterium]